MNELKKIGLTRMSIKNFTGIKDLEIIFDEKGTRINGDNGTGKTSVEHAFKWVMFNKNADNKTDFSIKPLDENNEPLHGLETSVIAYISFEGREKEFGKTLKEKLTKQHGTARKIVTGHDINYYYNGDKVSMTKFKEEVANLIDEFVFKLLTDPMYFSLKLKWEERREIVMAIAGEITDDNVISLNKKLKPLTELLEKYKDEKNAIDALRKSIAQRKRAVNKELEQLPLRIDEANNAIEEVDSETLSEELHEKNEELKRLKNQKESATPEVDETKNKLTELALLKTKLESDAELKRVNKESSLNTRLVTAKNELKNLETELTNFDDLKPQKEKEIKTQTKIADETRESWVKLKSSTFEVTADADEFICPTCNRAFEDIDIESKKKEMEENFNLNKANGLKKIEEKGIAASNKVKELKAEIGDDKGEKISSNIENKNNEISQIQNEIDSLTLEYADEYSLIVGQYDQLKVELTTPKNVQENLDELITKIKDVEDRIETIKTELRKVESNKKQEARIEELKAREEKLSQDYTDLEKQENLTELFIKTNVSMVEDRINGLFSVVKFKMFNKNISNDGIEPTCIPLINGVPFPDANHASKINGGIDIINVLSKHYGITAPMFIDGAESVTKFIDTEVQTIKMIVDKDEKKLVINKKSKVA